METFVGETFPEASAMVYLIYNASGAREDTTLPERRWRWIYQHSWGFEAYYHIWLAVNPFGSR